jgi:hypothetical protein
LRYKRAEARKVSPHEVGYGGAVHVRSFAKTGTLLSGCPRIHLALSSWLSPDLSGCRMTTCFPGVLCTFSQVRKPPAGFGAEGRNRTGDTMIFSF